MEEPVPGMDWRCARTTRGCARTLADQKRYADRFHHIDRVAAEWESLLHGLLATPDRRDMAAPRR